MPKQPLVYVDPNPTRTRRTAVAEEAITKYSLDATAASKLREAAKTNSDLFAAELLSVLISKVSA